MGNGKYDNEYFIKQGFVPLKDYLYPNNWVCNFGASHTLEYAFSCYAAAQMAKALGKQPPTIPSYNTRTLTKIYSIQKQNICVPVKWMAVS